MSIGQAVLTAAVLDTAAVDAVGARLQAGERARAVQHAAQLVDALALHRLYDAAAMDLGTPAELALLLGCSETRAGTLLTEAFALDRLGALAPDVQGLLTVEQSRAATDVLGPVEDTALACSLWERLRTRLERADEPLPPARLRELLQSWLIAADPKGAVERQKAATRDSADVVPWRREDGLLDIALLGVTGPNAQAVLDSIVRRAEPIGPYDDRTVGQRRRDAAIDLLTGRNSFQFGGCDCPADGCPCAPPPACPGGGCGCGIGAEVPCGAQVFVHVPLPTALDAGDDPAELVGHGPLDPDLLGQLLHSAPVLHRVWVDPATGVPVAVDDRTWQPARRDREAVRAALLDIGSGPPPPPEQRHPVHPDDHPAPPGPATPSPELPDPGPSRPRVLTRPHRTDPGPYVPPRRLKRLLRARAPRCEWPGCGRRAHAVVKCDLDHDLPWPAGPTCACNLGPLCRRHHRIKQLGWTKQRQPDGSIRWTGPTGRHWTSTPQHPVPVQTRPVPPLPAPDPFAGLTQHEIDELAAALDPDHAHHADRDADLTEPTWPAPTPPTTADLWSLLRDDSAWHDWPDPGYPSASA